MVEKVQIYCLKEDDITIDAYVEFRNGDILFTGCDMGDRVENQTGDYDYEYWVTVPKEEIPKLRNELRATDCSNQQLLEMLARKFKGDGKLGDTNKIIR